MKLSLLFTALYLSFLLSTPIWAAQQTVTLKIEGMTCSTCPLTVKSSLKKLSGVQMVDVSRATNLAQIIYDDEKTNVPALMEATTNAGYPSKLQK